MIPIIPVIPILPIGIPGIRNGFRKIGEIYYNCRMLFADYQSLIVLNYQKKRGENTLHPYLVQPTPATLRDACKIICDERYDRRDEQALKTFFGQGNDKATFLKAIDRCEIDGFRPLINFLKDPSIRTGSKNVELLAWLIDFKPRPWDSRNKEIPAAEPEDASKAGDIETKEPTAESPDINTRETLLTPTQVNRPVSALRARNVILPLIILVLLGGAIYLGIYQGRDNKGPVMGTTGPQGCMYWTGDHYQQIRCGQKPGDTLVVALDPEKLANFKRITQPDTITTNSIRAVWYVKINGRIEYYTSGGFHPVDPRLRLKPITVYMIRQHIHPVQQADKLSE